MHPLRSHNPEPGVFHLKKEAFLQPSSLCTSTTRMTTFFTRRTLLHERAAYRKGHKQDGYQAQYPKQRMHSCLTLWHCSFVLVLTAYRSAQREVRMPLLACVAGYFPVALDVGSDFFLDPALFLASGGEDNIGQH
jgi:hypothetical protein